MLPPPPVFCDPQYWHLATGTCVNLISPLFFPFKTQYWKMFQKSRGILDKLLERRVEEGSLKLLIFNMMFDTLFDVPCLDTACS